MVNSARVGTHRGCAATCCSHAQLLKSRNYAKNLWVGGIAWGLHHFTLARQLESSDWICSVRR